MSMEKEMPVSKERLNESGILVLLTGGSAVGKTELKERMSQKYNLNFVVSSTTRHPRAEKGEKGGRDYHFLNWEEFGRKLDNKDFFEYAFYDGNLYGTTKDEIEPVFRGINLIAAMEMSGAANFENNIRNAYSQDKADQIMRRTVTVLIEAESEEILRERDIKRRMGKIGGFEKRLAEDKALMEMYGHLFPIRIVNEQNKIEQTIEKLKEAIETKFSQNKLLFRK